MANDPSIAVAGAGIPERWRPYQYYALTLITLIVVLNYMDRYSLSLLQEPIKHELELSDWQLGLLSGPFFTLFYSVGGVVIARYADRMHRGSLIAGSLAVWSLMTALCGATANFVQLALCRLGMGTGEGGCIPISLSLSSETFSKRQRGLVMAIIGAGNPISGIIAPVIIPFVAHAFGWRAAFFAVGLPGIAVALLVYFTLREPRALREPAGVEPPLRASFFADARALFANPVFKRLWLGALFTGVGVSGIGAFRVSYLIRAHGMDLIHAGAVWSTASAVGLIGAVIGGSLADRFADERGRSYPIVGAIGLVMTFAGYYVGFTATDTKVAVIALIAGSFAYNFKDGPVYAAMQNAVPTRLRSTAAAVYMFGATALGGGLGPMVAGGVSDLVASHQFHDTLSAYDAACPGGRAIAGAAAAMGQACIHSAAQGVRWALVVVSAAFAIGGLFNALAARHMHQRAPD